MGNKQIKSTEMQRKDLNLYFSHLLETKLQFHRSEEEVLDIEKAVNLTAERIASALGKQEESMKIMRIVSVGSMKEGTKIREPDEFDFLLVLEKPSKPGTINIIDENENGIGYKHVIIKDDTLRSQWGHCLQGNLLKGTMGSGISYFFHWLFGYDFGLRQEFYKQLQKAVTAVVTNERTRRLEAGEMSIRNVVDRHGPAFTLTFDWKPFDKNSKSLKISVDLTPSIQLELTEEILEESRVYDQRFYQALKNTNRYMIVPCNRASSCWDGLCFRLTFTETEVQLLSTNKHEFIGICPRFQDYTWLFADSILSHHIRCYKVMKYIFESDSPYKIEVFKSYTLKTILLKHMCECGRNDDISSCVMDLSNECINAMSDARGNMLHISNIFITDLNIIHRKKLRSPPKYFRRAIKNMMSSLTKIGNSNDYKTGKVRKVNTTIRQFQSNLSPGYIVPTSIK